MSIVIHWQKFINANVGIITLADIEVQLGKKLSNIKTGKMTKNTNENTSDSNTDFSFVLERKEYTSAEVIHGIIGHPNGNCYKIANKDLTSVYLSLIEGNQLNTCPISMLLHNINTGIWKFYTPGDESWREKVYTQEVLDYKNNVLKSLIYNQLCAEANDALIGTVEHEPYLNNLLKKANKGLQRKSKKYLIDVYKADSEMMENVLNAIDKFEASMAKTLPHEYFYLNSIVEEYQEDPTKYIGRKVKINTLIK
jgi:hypothetical protein